MEKVRCLLLYTLVFVAITSIQGKTISNYTFVCQEDKFKCKAQKCIPSLWRCDGDNDCGDNSDEEKCFPSTCRPHYEFQCKSGKCIPNRWRCDGTPECADRSDEENCEKTCDPNFYKCKGAGICIPNKWLCDGHNDCGDNEDEKGCKEVIVTCKETHFKCGDNKCISKAWLCDKEFDCNDKSDEQGCKYPDDVTCQSSQFACADGKTCISKTKKCDKKKDCLDNSDERNCNYNKTNTCGDNFWQCDSGSCIKSAWKCDGSKDCLDGSDEKHCLSVTCDNLEFACKNKLECISKNKKCDGTKQCSDGSDEDDCESSLATPKPTQSPLECSPEMFKCRNGTCIPESKVCDGIFDCNFHEDEPMACGINECELFDGHCSQECTDLKLGFECSCREGYKLSDDLRTCEDIDECQLYGACHQLCTNIKGSYVCSCVDGYVLEGNKKSCRIAGPDYWIYFANQVEIRKLSSDGLLYDVAVKDLDGVVSFDFNLAKQEIYMTDMISETIKVAKLDQPNSVKTLMSNVHTPDGLAVDWVTDKIYWTDAGYKTIEVATLDGKNNADIVNVGLNHPRAISLDPLEGYIYWTDWGVSAGIEKISMDGDLKTRKVIASGNMVWPNGMSLDLTQKKIYWIDAKLRRIEVVDLDGKNRRVIRNTGIVHPFSLDNFEDQLYYTDWSLRSVNQVSKFSESNIVNIKRNLTAPMDIKILHVTRQPTSENPCSVNNNGCSHLCLLGNRNGTRIVSCKCPRNMTLMNGKTCQGIQVTRPPRTKLSTPTLATDKPPVKQSTKKAMKTVSPRTSTQKVTQGKTSNPEVRSGRHKVQEADEGMSSGVIFAIAISIILGLVLIIFVIFYVKRRHSNKTQVLYYKDMSTAPLEDDFYTQAYDENDDAKIITNDN